MRALRAAILAALLLVCSASAAHADAPAPIDWHGPRHAHGGVLVLHGGAWKATGTAAQLWLRPEARRFAGLGLAVANADYRPRGTSLRDALRAYDALRRRAHRVCVYGQS